MATIQVPPLRFPEVEGPADSAIKAISLRNLVSRGQLEQEQLRAAQAANVQREQDAQDSQIMTQALVESNGDYNAWLKAIPRLGGSAKVVMAANKHLADMRKAAMEEEEGKHKLRLGQSNHVLGVMNAIEALPPEQQPRAWEAAVPKLVSDGIVTQEEAAPYLQYPGADKVPAIKALFQMQDNLLKERTVATEAQRAKAYGENIQSEIAARNIAAPGEAAQGALNVHKMIAQRMGMAGTPLSWAAARASLAGVGPDNKPRVPADLLDALVPKEYSPEARQQVRSLGQAEANTIEESIVRAQAAGDKAKVDELVALKGRIAKATHVSDTEAGSYMALEAPGRGLVFLNPKSGRWSAVPAELAGAQTPGMLGQRTRIENEHTIALKRLESDYVDKRARLVRKKQDVLNEQEMTREMGLLNGWRDREKALIEEQYRNALGAIAQPAVTTAPPAAPPAAAFTGGEGVTHNFRNKRTGKTEQWKLVNGIPTRVTVQ